MAMALSHGTSVQIGPHDLARDGRFLKVTMHGEISLDQSSQISAHYEAVIEEQGFVLIVLDVRDGAMMEMRARKASAEWVKTYGDRTRSAVIGAPFVIRTAIELINRAANLLARRKAPVGFVDTEEEARRWLIAQIPILQQAAPLG